MSWMTDNADNLRNAAADRRARGLPTGKQAKGWNVTRAQPDPESWDYVRATIKARLRDHWAQVRADYEAAAYPDRVMPF
jgi:hypothetical protein